MTPEEKTIYNLLKNIPEDTHDEYLSKLTKYKKLIDRTPDKFLNFHLTDCIKKERYELAQYIKNKK